jgi:dTMP kinase
VLLAASTESLEPLTELFLFAAQRAEHCAVRVGPALVAGRTVVSDRFSASTLAYQGYGRGLDLALVRRVCDIASGGRWPDLNVVLDVPAAVAAERRGRPADRFEREDAGFHARVAAGFAALAAAEPERYVVVDGTAAPAEVHERVLAAVSERLGTILPR